MDSMKWFFRRRGVLLINNVRPLSKVYKIFVVIRLLFLQSYVNMFECVNGGRAIFLSVCLGFSFFCNLKMEEYPLCRDNHVLG